MKTYLVQTIDKKFVAVNTNSKKAAYQAAKDANYQVKKIVIISSCHSDYLLMQSVIAIIN